MRAQSIHRYSWGADVDGDFGDRAGSLEWFIFRSIGQPTVYSDYRGDGSDHYRAFLAHLPGVGVDPAVECVCSSLRAYAQSAQDLAELIQRLYSGRECRWQNRIGSTRRDSYSPSLRAGGSRAWYVDRCDADRRAKAWRECLPSNRWLVDLILGSGIGEHDREGLCRFDFECFRIRSGTLLAGREGEL